MKRSFVIIGAGPCGLGAAYRLESLGIGDYVVLEQASGPGGLSATRRDKAGFAWDMGGHVIHSHYPYFDAMLSGTMGPDTIRHDRSAFIRYGNGYVPYPFQNNIHRLPEAVRDRCLTQLRRARGSAASMRTFGDWLRASYGDGITEEFMLPYNRKVWSTDPSRMQYRWIGDRVAPVDVARIERSVASGDDDTAWGPNAVFSYPSRGGTGEIWNRLAASCGDRVRTGTAVSGVDPVRRIVRTGDGGTVGYDHLLSTVPLPDACRMVEGISPHGADGLTGTSVAVVGIGMRGTVPARLADKCWIYYPQPDIPFYRVTVFSRYAPDLAPDGHWSLMCEVSFPGPHTPPPDELIDACIDGARRASLLQRGDTVVDRYCTTAYPAYPVPTLDRDGIADPVLAGLDAAGVSSRGRLGTWKYEIGNMDHAFMQGVEWVDHIRSGSPETVYRSALH